MSRGQKSPRRGGIDCVRPAPTTDGKSKPVLEQNRREKVDFLKNKKMDLNSTVLTSIFDRTNYNKRFLKTFTSAVLFLYNHMIYFVGIPQLVLNLMVVFIIIYSSKVIVCFSGP